MPKNVKEELPNEDSPSENPVVTIETIAEHLYLAVHSIDEYTSYQVADAVLAKFNVSLK